MDTYMDLQLWGPDRQAAADELQQMLYRLESTWSASDPDSLIFHMDRAGEQEKAFLQEIEAFSARTGGAFDPYMGKLVESWGFLTKEYRIPAAEELNRAKRSRQLDLGGAVKGYAGRLAVELLGDLQVDRAVLNLGGNIQTYGHKTDGTPWSIGIQNPDGGDPVGILSVVGTTAVVTSGDYQRFFEQDGKRYHHILDPQTGCPAATGLTAVTVICADGLTADVLSTALFVMGLEKGADLWRQSDDFEAVFILSDGSIRATEGAALSGCEYEVIFREN